ncbi:DEAD/DEAH box helicase family protein, partial [Deferrisoma palaeochoriense]
MTEVPDPTASPPPGKPPLPIDPHLPGICAALGRDGAAVVVAPPGSGKTTRIPPALLAAGLLGEGICVVLEPRRIAARAAGRGVAEENRWGLGPVVGYHVRQDRCGTRETPYSFVTLGVLVARLHA